MRIAPLLALVVAVALALAVPSAAQAHARLVGSEPADQAVLGTAPRVIRLRFDDDVRPEAGVRAIANAGGNVLAGRPRLTGSRELDIPVRPGVAPGDYTVLWRVLSDDGHSIAGVVAFGVGKDRPRPHAVLAAPSEADPLRVVTRWIYLVGILLAAGAALFGFLVRRDGRTDARLLLAGFGMVYAGGGSLVLRSSLDTRFGLVVACSIAVAVAGSAAILAGRRRPRVSGFGRVAAVALLAAPSLSGHALDAGSSPVQFIADLLHVATASIWLGGLASLALHVRAGRSDDRVVRRFSRLAGWSVVALGASGVVRMLAELGTLGQLWTTGYGRLLLVKTAVLAALVGLGAANRLLVVPRLPGTRPALRRNVMAELVLFGGLLVAVALLTQARPGADRALAAAPSTKAPAEGEADIAAVLRQEHDGLELSARAQSAVLVGGAVLWQSMASDEEPDAQMLERRLATRRTRPLVDSVAPQYGIAAAAGWAAYGTGTLPSRLVAVRPRDDRRLVLSPHLLAPPAARGHRLAWAEQRGADQRIVVRDLARGREWVAANMPACERGRCYRIDAVTLADDGVAFDRGAVGSYPSSIVRRDFSAARPESVRLAGDPQPDLVPSSAGALYYAVGRGWFRWDFGSRTPRRLHLAAADAPLRFERGRWYLQRRSGCGSTLEVEDASGRSVGSLTRGQVLGVAGAGGDLCTQLLGVTLAGGRPVSTWALVPADGHSSEGVTGVIVLGRPAP